MTASQGTSIPEVPRALVSCTRTKNRETIISSCRSSYRTKQRVPGDPLRFARMVLGLTGGHPEDPPSGATCVHVQGDTPESRPSPDALRVSCSFPLGLKPPRPR